MAVDPLLPLLTDDDVNYKVAWALGEIGDARAVPALIATLQNKDAFVRGSAIASLGKLHAIRALPHLTALFADSAVPSAGDRHPVGVLARLAADGIRRGRVNMYDMTGRIAALVLLYGTWIGSPILLWLFARALVHHRRTSFLLLLAATLCGLGYAISMQFAARVPIDTMSRAELYSLLQSLLLLAQIVLGIWGIALLLRDYAAMDLRHE
jgi:hypothetical protein